MHLTRLVLSHFRSHSRCDLRLDGRPVAVFGANGSGKTNLIEAVSLFSPGRGLRRAGVDTMARQPEAIGWRLVANLAGPDGVHEIETRAEPGTGRLIRIDGKTATQAALAKVVRVLWLVPAMDRLWIEGADGRRRFLDRMTMSFRPSHAEVTLRYEKAMRQRNRLLKDQQRDAAWYTALETRMDDAGREIIENRRATVERLAIAQEEGQTDFPISDLSIFDPEGAPEFSARSLFEGRARDMAAGRTLIGPHRADLAAVYRGKGVSAELASTGEQKALLISLILANARALLQDTGAPPVLLMDEVAAHLDASRRTALYEEIVSLGSQAFLTGTGRELFSELGSRAQFAAVSEAEGESRVLME